MRGVELTGRWEQMHMTQTLGVAILVGAEAQRRNVSAYIRVTYPCESPGKRGGLVAEGEID